MEMDIKEFIHNMEVLLPCADSEAVKCAALYALELEREGEYSAKDYYAETYVEFCLIVRSYGRELAGRLLDACKTFALNPSELRGAVNYLSYGTTPERIGALALDGKCERTAREMLEFDEAMDDFEDGTFRIPR